jgi:Na+-transporting NADH:ubiquinone oxidoreductase subunit B
MKNGKLRQVVDKIKPTFEKGGKLSFLQSTFEGFETFLFVPNTVTKKGTHIRDGIDLKRTMALVVIALIPALLVGMFNVGYQQSLSTGVEVNFWELSNLWYGFLRVFPLIVVSYVTGLGIEFIVAQIKGHEINEGFLVSGMLIPLIVPIDVPLWMVAVATAFAVIIGKEIFGGTGMNIFNVALITRAFLFFAYPSYLSGDRVWIDGLLKGEGVVDGFSGATPLADAAAGVVDRLPSTLEMFMGYIPGSIGETSTLAILIGAVILIYTGVGSWKIILSGVLGGAAMGLLLNATAVNPLMEVPFYEHLMLGGFAFGIVFMATDPVTAAQTELGKWIYGFLIGVIAILVRVVNPAYPEGVMLAILFMNVFAPLIDHYIVQANIRRRLKRAKA